MTNKTTQFTPGPWSAYNSKNGVIYKHWRVNTGTGLILLDDAAHWEAGNATLIAAAPAMYEALLQTCKVIEAIDDYQVFEDLQNVLIAISKTLAQAEGREA